MQKMERKVVDNKQTGQSVTVSGIEGTCIVLRVIPIPFLGPVKIETLRGERKWVSATRVSDLDQAV
jgi:hypothetical protein